MKCGLPWGQHANLRGRDSLSWLHDHVQWAEDIVGRAGGRTGRGRRDGEDVELLPVFAESMKHRAQRRLLTKAPDESQAPGLLHRSLSIDVPLRAFGLVDAEERGV